VTAGLVPHTAEAWANGNGTVLSVDQRDELFKGNGPGRIADVPEGSGESHSRDLLEPYHLPYGLPVATQQLVAKQQLDVTCKDIEKKRRIGLFSFFIDAIPTVINPFCHLPD